MLVLAVGLVTTYSFFPTLPAQDWRTIHVFDLTSEECLALREQRQTNGLLIPPEASSASFAEVAKKFRLELALVCQANGQAADCGDAPLTPGVDSVILPLGREALPPAAP